MTSDISNEASLKKPRSLSPSEVIALTPPSSADILVRGYTIPWIQFHNLFHSLVSLPATRSVNPTYSDMLSNWQPRSNDLVKIVNNVKRGFLAASDHGEAFSGAMAVVQSELPNRSVLGTITQCHAFMFNPVVQVFEWLVYGLTNNLMRYTDAYDAYDVLSPFFKNSLSSRFLEKICSEGGSTMRILLFRLLECAFKKEDVPFVKSLLELGDLLDIKEIRSLERTTLGYEAKLQNSEMVKLLLQRGVDPNRYQFGNLKLYPETPLILAFERLGGYDIVKLLVDAGAFVGTPTQPRYSEDTPLMLASKNRDFRAATLLIERGAAINTITKSCPSALQRAIAGNSFELVVLLLNNGADPNIRHSSRDDETKWGNDWGSITLLPLAAVAWHGSDIKIAQYLLDYGADIDGFIPSDISYSDHHTALQTSVQRCDFAMTEFLLCGGASPNTRDVKTPTALQQACQLLCKDPGQREIIDLLLSSGADVNADPPTVDGGEFALQIAIQSGNYDLVTSLISYGGNINSPPSCLHIAISLEHLNLAKLLLKLGAKANSQHCYDGKTVLQIALSLGNTKLVELLLGAGAVLNTQPSPSGMTDLQAVLLSENMELVQIVVRSGANINENTREYHQTPLELAASSGTVELLRLLIETKTTINQQSFSAALELAVLNGCVSVARFLLDIGVDIDIRTIRPRLLYRAITSRCKELFDLFFIQSANQDMSAELGDLLVAAIEQKWLYAVDRLIEAGVDVNNPCVPTRMAAVCGSNAELIDFHASPLHKAVESRQVTLVERLVRAGGDIQTRGLECLGIAVKLGSADIVRLLLEHGVNPNHIIPGTSLTPLHLSLMPGHGDGSCLELNIVRALIDYKASANAYSPKVGYPLEIFWHRFFNSWMGHYFEESVTLSDPRRWLQARDLLLEAGADPKLLPSALQAAAHNGDIERVRLLIANGEEINRPAVKYKGATALQYAAMHGHFNIVALLLKNAAHIHAPGATIDGRTALQGAAENGRLDIVRLLLENDDETEFLEERCCDAAKYAVNGGHQVIAEDLWAWSCMKIVSTMPHEGCGI